MSSVRLLHGAAVDVAGDFFFEGAWDGPWSAGPPDDAVLFGTGARVDRHRVTVYGSSYKMHVVYVTGKDGQWFVSNSLAFVLAASADELDDSHSYCRHYKVAMGLGWRAIETGLNGFPLRHGRVVRGYSHCDLVFDADGPRTVRRHGLRLPERLGFDDYVSTLTACLTRIVDNARATARRDPPAAPIVALSAGYDSAAVAVLGRDAGYREAVTLDAGVGDAGTHIGAALGLRTHTLPRTQTEDPTELATVFAMPCNAVHAPWFAMKGELEGRIVLTGWHGDTMWATAQGCLFSGEFASRVSGAGLPEARLWLNCLFVPIAAAGDGDIHRVLELSRSSEMERYRVGGDYDRPIPRRLAAMAGVDQLLARTKLGSSAATLTAVPRHLEQEANAILRRLSLIEPTSFARLGREQFAAAGWRWHYDRPVGDRTMALEAIFRWGIRHLALRYQRALGERTGSSASALTESGDVEFFREIVRSIVSCGRSFLTQYSARPR